MLAAEWLHRRWLAQNGFTEGVCFQPRAHELVICFEETYLCFIFKNGGRERSDRSSTSVARRTLLHVLRTDLESHVDDV